jgi:hypothetical protein
VGIAQVTDGENERVLQSAIAQLGAAQKLSMRWRDTVENWRKSDPIAARKPKSFSPRFDSV